MKYVRSRQRGVTVPMLAISIVVLFAIAALAIDLGVLYTARTSAQHAADAAALAGAYTFMDPVAVQPDAAQNAAINVAVQNQVMGQNVVITADNVHVDEANRRVTVTVPRTGANGVLTYFAPVVGWRSVDIITQATAEAGLNGLGSYCLKPIFIPNTILSDLPTAEAACTASQPQIIFVSTDGGNTYHFSDWFLQYANSSSAPGPLYGKGPVSVRPINPSGALVPSNYYSLDFGSGGSTYRCTLGQCLNDCGVDTQQIQCGKPYPIETGNMVGPTKQGVDDLIGNPHDFWGGQDSNGYWFHYQGQDGPQVYSSRSVAVAPVWDSCDLKNQFSPGTHGQSVKVIGFVTLFFDGVQGQDVLAHFMRSTECPSSGEGSNGSPSGNFGPGGVPIRLVQTPTSQ